MMNKYIIESTDDKNKNSNIVVIVTTILITINRKVKLTID